MTAGCTEITKGGIASMVTLLSGPLLTDILCLWICISGELSGVECIELDADDEPELPGDDESCNSILTSLSSPNDLKTSRRISKAFGPRFV